MSSKIVFGLIAVMFGCMIALYIYLSHQVLGGIVAAVVMLIIAFFFATVSGYLVGIIGSTNNPISGLTLTTLIIAALLMVSLGVSGPGGVAVVLGVAAVACVSSAVAGELLQDFKVGYILGGTPRRIQIAELIAVVVASAAMYWPLYILQAANIKSGGIGFGDPKLSAPQAGLMATLAQGIVGGDMPWPLVVVGVMFGIVMIMVRVKSPCWWRWECIFRLTPRSRFFWVACSAGSPIPCGSGPASTKRKRRALRTWAYSSRPD